MEGNIYYIKFGYKLRGRKNYIVRCNVINKELSYTYTKFNPKYNWYEEETIVYKLVEEDLELLKEYIVVQDFEIYRDEKLREDGLAFFPPLVSEFEGITDTYIPIIKLKSINYDGRPQPPVEILVELIEERFLNRINEYNFVFN